jgi:hypothetical protein
MKGREACPMGTEKIRVGALIKAWAIFIMVKLPDERAVAK